MFGDPPVTSETVVSLLDEHWLMRDVAIEYAPVGFGSYHWSVTDADTRLFATLDDFGGVTGKERARWVDSTRRAYECAARLVKRGCGFVRGPIPTAAGETVVNIDDRIFTVWPYLDGRASLKGEYHADGDRRAVLSVLAELHAVELAGLDPAVETFDTAQSEFLERVLQEPGEGWDRGPYGERARALLVRDTSGIRRLLAHYDHLVANAPGRDEWVLTHGEPHAANVVFTSGGPVLIDWDTAAIAPRERDLWMVVTDDAAVTSAYANATGYTPDPNMLKLYSAQWELGELGVYFNHFRNAHGDGADDRASWHDLNNYLPVARRWPQL